MNLLDIFKSKVMSQMLTMGSPSVAVAAGKNKLKLIRSKQIYANDTKIITKM